ncbi:hypothetical protein [Geodermatophilus sabuli]|uniref:Uncharacterized protein n=1 Tax=Geodermatophilus sabuli TaxID=1564158 RepID=A0A285EAV4_9ACTN|nr:hypothetical protein [Geodermatophilus sabuli]MBB3085476.1 hypothetical protein [Geodermatophilus sabuli]SNX96100.1 hypothetical protein SAMN06893097_103269 [Geodermatophilus sabuli]
MTEFVTLVALGVVVVGVGVLVAAYLLTAVVWLVARGVRRRGQVGPSPRDHERPPRGEGSHATRFDGVGGAGSRPDS